MNDGQNLPVEVFINKSAVGKIPRDAPRNAWTKFHANWNHEAMTARELAVNVWRGHAFAPVHNGRKVKEQFVGAWHLALDFDCADDRASFEELRKDSLIDICSSFLYYTPSSKPPAYKSRVVFIFDSPVMSLEKYEEILDTFAWWYPDSDQSTTDGSRFFYGSKGAEVYGNWSILPIKSAEYMIEQYRAEVPKAVKQTTVYKPKADDDKKVAEALRFIPTRMDYHDWLKVVMAVHSAFPNGNGVRLLESWSPGYDGEIEDKFKSFERTSTSGVTIKTLFKMAIDNGWKPIVNAISNKRSTMADKRKALMEANINDGTGYRIRRS